MNKDLLISIEKNQATRCVDIFCACASFSEVMVPMIRTAECGFEGQVKRLRERFTQSIVFNPQALEIPIDGSVRQHFQSSHDFNQFEKGESQ